MGRTTVIRSILMALPCLAALAHASRAQQAADPEAPRVQMGISVDVVPVSSEFSGQSIAVFGTVENADPFARLLNEYAIAVAIRGPLEDVVVRRKERIFGVWVNRQARVYRDVPSFYTIASNRELKSVADSQLLRDLELGVDNISLKLFSSGTSTFILPSPEFSGSLRRIQIARGLYSENPSGVVFLGSSLFRATLLLPSDVPIGRHTVTAYLFRNGQFLDSRSGTFEVRKIGFEEFIYTLAHQYSIWYGVLAVLVALATGWLGSVAFGNRR